MIFSNRKRILSAFLSLTMIGSMVASVPFTASAATKKAAKATSVSFSIYENSKWASALKGVAGKANKGYHVSAIKGSLGNAPKGASITLSLYENKKWISAANGKVAGTAKAKTAVYAEAFKAVLKKASGYSLSYSVFENKKWSKVGKDGAVVGTTGKKYKIEAVKISITKKAVAAVTVKSVSDVDDVAVANGTDEETAIALLPSTVVATLSNGKKSTVGVTWTADDTYNSTAAGSYAYSGKLDAISGVKNTKNVTAKANIVVGAAATIVSVAAVPVTTIAGSAPTLPATVTATLSDGSTANAAVTWDPITDASSYATAGVSFTVNGTVADTTVKAVATVTVVDAAVKTVADTTVSTVAGVEPVLPDTVTATFDNGTTKDVDVTWADIDASSYATAGATFAVSGTIVGTDVKAVANVTVIAVAVDSIVDTTVIVPAGVNPGTLLPATVVVSYNNNTTVETPVKWDAVTDASLYNTVDNTFTVSGTVDGTDKTATANVTVIDPQVVTIDDSPVTTAAGTAPVLPTTVTATLTDGTKATETVTWDPITADQYAKAGTFTVNGTIADSDDVVAKANVTVTALAAATIASIDSVNGSEITLTLANVSTTAPVATDFIVTDSNKATYAATAIASTTTAGQYKLTLGTAITGKGTLTVAYGTSTQTKDFDMTTAGFQLAISSKDASLTSNGADNTIITVKAMKDGVLDTNYKGTVKFTSLKGAKFAKDVVAFDSGIATVQLTSIASATAIQDTIIAAVSDSDDATTIGTVKQLTIDYVPSGSDANVNNQAFVTYAISDNASDVTVRFNQNIDFAKVYTAWTANKGLLTVTDLGATKAILDIVKVSDNTVKLVLDESARLTDNTTVTVASISSGVNSVFLDASTSFNLVDSTAPSAVGVTTPDYRTVVAQFTEPVAAGAATTAGNWVLNGHKLFAADIATIAVGKSNGTAVTTYIAPTATAAAIDNRNFVTISLTATGAAYLNTTVGGANLLQAYNISDYAGLSDTTGQNVAGTQEFRFVTPTPPSAPTATVTAQSAEQYLVTFNTAVSNLAGADLSDANFKFEIETSVDANGVPVYAPVTLENTKTAAADAVVTKVDSTHYLIQLEEDWTVRDATATSATNYYTPNHNLVKVTVFSAGVQNLLQVKMAADSVTTLTNTLDTTAPTILTAAQSKDASGNLLPSVTVTMSEPVQMNAANGSVVITPSQQQSITSGGVPVPTFEFVNADQSKTINGTLTSTGLDDQSFIVSPAALLDAGTWTVITRSISDDVGNTSSTNIASVTIAGATASVGTPRVIWATAEDNVDTTVSPDTILNANGIANADIVHIQYGTTMSLDALTSGVYTINGKAIPYGSHITSVNNSYVTDAGTRLYGTLVTIELPNTFLGDSTTAPVDAYWGTPTVTSNMLNISKSLTDSNGNVILTPYQIPLNYNFYPTVATVTATAQQGTQYAATATTTAGLVLGDAVANGKPVVTAPATTGTTTGATNNATDLVETFGEGLYNNFTALTTTTGTSVDVTKYFTGAGVTITSATYDTVAHTVTFALTVPTGATAITDGATITESGLTDLGGLAPAHTVAKYAATGTLWTLQ